MPERKTLAPGFAITSGQGFHITFANGWTLSVQFGPGHYCQHRNETFNTVPREHHIWRSDTAECAIIDPVNGLIEWPFGSGARGDTVEGYVLPNDLVYIVMWVAMQPAREGPSDGQLA